VSKVKHPARHITGHYGDGPPGNHFHWYSLVRTTKINSKVYQTNTKTQNTIIYYLHTHAHKRNTN